MPILFKTAIQEGAVHGKGVFALEDIPKGATWWVADPEAKPATDDYLPNVIYTQDNIHELTDNRSPAEVAAILHETMHYVEGGVLIHLRDGTQPTNHSFEGNSEYVHHPTDWRKIRSVAGRDIKAGEEITENYSNYTKKTGGWVEQLWQKYLPERLQFEDKQGIKQVKGEQ